MKPYRYKRIKGTKQVSGRQIEITLAIAGQIMVQITGNDTDEASIEKYLSAMDFKRIKNSLSQ